MRLNMPSINEDVFKGADPKEVNKRKESYRTERMKVLDQDFSKVDEWLTPKLLKLRKEWVKDYITYGIEADEYADTFSNSSDGSEEYAQYPLYYNAEEILKKVNTPAGRRVLKGLRRVDMGGPEEWNIHHMNAALYEVAKLFYGGELPESDEIL